MCILFFSRNWIQNDLLNVSLPKEKVVKVIFNYTYTTCILVEETAQKLLKNEWLTIFGTKHA